MKIWDLNAGVGKLELAVKLVRAAAANVEQQWTDDAHRDFEETYLTPLEPNVRDVLDAIHRLAEVLAAAERQCNSYLEGPR